MFSKIMVLFDFSWPSRRALTCALTLGESFRSEIVVAHAIGREEARGHPAEMGRFFRAQIEKELQTRKAPGPEKTKAVRIEVRTGRPSETLLEMIDQEKPDLVLAGTHGVTGLTHVFLGSVAERIVRHSTAPVFVVRRSDFPPRAILIPVDWEDDAEEALLLASELRNAFNASIELIHVVEAPVPLSVPPEAAPFLVPFDEDAAVRESRVRLRGIASKHPLLPIVEHAAVGQPADEICRTAQRIGADLILMPTRGRKGVSRLLLGSVAEQVVRYAPCHVLTFHPGKFRR